jgi:solute carrier family 25 citrate transporter 1
VKTKLQLTRRLAKAQPNAPPPPFNGMISCFRYTVQTTGFLSLYRGMLPVLLGSVPKAGLRFGMFDYLDQLFLKADGSTTSVRTLVAGSTAGAIEALLVVTPVETLKTKLIDLNMGSVKGTQHILKTEGFSGIYRGAIPTTLKQGSNQGLRFMAFSKYKQLVSEDGQNLDPARAMLGGMLAGCFSTLLNNPFDAVKTRMQGTQAKELYSGFFDCVRQIVKYEGVLTLWSGVVPRLARVVPGQGIIFASSETITGWTSRYLD